MNTVRKYEFVDDKGNFSVVETTSERNPKDIPEGNGRFCRTWLGTAGFYKVSRLRVSDSPFVNTFCAKGGYVKLKNKDYVG